MSFSSSFERPRFKLRSHRKRMANTRRMGSPIASVASTMVRSRESRDVRDSINGSLQAQDATDRVPLRGGRDKRGGLSAGRRGHPPLQNEDKVKIVVWR